jgi:tRNA A-37 threonylcarbamoyl transferase component Bud32
VFERLKLSDFPARSGEVLRRATATRPVIWTLEEDGVEAVVKDFSRNGTLFRHTIGRFLVWREEKAYRRLRGVKGVPVLYRVLDGMALVMERVPGESLEDLEKKRKLPKSFFDALEAIVADAHARGVAHCDLKRAPNLLLGRDGKPYIVDWSAAVCRTELSLFPFNLIYRRLLLDDLHAITKMQLRHCPEEVSKERLDGYRRRSAAEKLVRRVRDRMREILKRVAML